MPMSRSIWRESGGALFNFSPRQALSMRDDILQASPKGIVPEGVFTPLRMNPIASCAKSWNACTPRDNFSQA